ncbi:MAG: DJ-1/PfpI family protein [Candidatus Omnitrophica bacterium]|nr:DJ-1/PfpI family protein [Candidatus Omnitrophota bacterium]
MKKVLIPIADGFEDIEMTVIADVLRRAEVEVTIAGIKEGPVTGARKIKVIPDTTLEKVSVSDFDLLALPGGQPGVNHLKADPKVIECVQIMSKNGKWIAAICAAPLILKEAGLAVNVHLTSHPSVENEMSSGNTYQTGRVVTDGKLITSRGPGTAIEFALELVKILVSEKKAVEISRAMIC